MSTSLGWQIDGVAPLPRSAPDTGNEVPMYAQDRDPTAEPEGPLHFITDPAIRDDAEERGFAHDGIEDVMPSADGRSITVLFGDSTAKTYGPEGGER